MVQVPVINSDGLPPITLKALRESYGLINLAPGSPEPDWLLPPRDPIFVSATRSIYGFSIICPEAWVPANAQVDHMVGGWRVLRVEEPRDWAMHGLYARLTAPLAEDAISIYLVGAYNSDHLLVRGADYDRAVQILSRFCNFV